MHNTLVLKTLSELRQWRASLEPRTRVGLIPTMGALHEGHLSLIQASRARTEVSVVSIFVNPTQFGPNEDFSKYPRPIEKDLALLQSAGAHVLFAPTVDQLFETDHSTTVIEEKVSSPLCGALRPGHFKGVATIVLKLFNLVQPHVSFFGQKDAQQCAVIKRMIRDLNVPVELVICPTLRESDGLAMSSRNSYLSSSERMLAPEIFKGLQKIQTAVDQGERSVPRLIESASAALLARSEFKLQYFELVHPDTFEAMDSVGSSGALALVAAYLGTTRLIDNLLILG